MSQDNSESKQLGQGSPAPPRPEDSAEQQVVEVTSGKKDQENLPPPYRQPLPSLEQPPEIRMEELEEFKPETKYQSFDKPEDDDIGNSNLPSRYRTKDPEKAARSQARAEARRTRRTMRLQQQQQQQQQQQKQLVTKNDSQQHYRISSSESEGSSVDENLDVLSIADSEVENLTWRGRMQHALHNHYFHLLIIVLVSLDALIVIFELLIDVGAFQNVLCEGSNFLDQARDCHFRQNSMQRDEKQCGPYAMMILDKINITASPTGNGNNTGICRCGFRNGQRVCIRRNDALGINPAFVLHILSLVILSTFMIEVLLKLIAFRLKYFTHKFEVFDGLIVVISWLLDIASIVEEEAFEAASLLIVLRLWRVVRIVNGAILSSKAQSDLDLEHARREARRIIHALHKSQDKMDDLEAENIHLKKLREKENELGRGKAIPIKS